ncbi:MAG: DNA repair protein RecN [Myxococcales bacterium]|nr:DNA repair protein RecN [Myxococcales bacterium]
MLVHLSIRNLALVEHLEFSLEAGLTVLTGETGAGKSILINAFSLLLGGKASPDLVREGEEEGEVEGLLEVESGSVLADRLEALGLASSDGQVVIRRTLRKRGRGRVCINGQAATVGMLEQLLGGWMDLTSQHQHVALLDPLQHLDLLDAFAGLTEIRDEVGQAYRSAQAVRDELKRLQTDDAEIERRKDYLRFAIDEIGLVNPVNGELEALQAERKRLRSADELINGLQRAEASLYSAEGAVVEQLGAVARTFSSLAALDGELLPCSERIDGLLVEVDELAREVSRYVRHVEAQPDRLAEVEDRIHALERLVRKYGGRIEDVLGEHSSMAAELLSLDDLESQRTEIEARLVAEEAALQEVASSLSKARTGAAKEFVDEVAKALGALSMLDTRVVMDLVTQPTVGPRGAETAELMFSPNKGESLRPLRKSASGGELSRVLLAIKQVLAGRQPVGIQVFDEVDTGIGGAVAEAVGAQLGRVADAGQVLVVTHLPQVAAFADHHIRVFKEPHRNRTVTRIERLSLPGRTLELARMLGGAQVTARTKALADELRTRATEQRYPNTSTHRRARSKKSTVYGRGFCTSPPTGMEKLQHLRRIERQAAG